jgi:LAO/AO transport system kinase
MLDLSHATRAAQSGEVFEIPIVKCVASENAGVDELWRAVDAHWDFLRAGTGLLERETLRARTELVELLRERMLRAAVDRLAASGARLDDLAVRIARREIDPYQVAEEAATA